MRAYQNAAWLNRLTVLAGALTLAALVACGGAPTVPTEVPDSDVSAEAPVVEPESEPESQEADILANDGTREIGDVTRCPVSGETFTVVIESPKVEHDGGTYYLCCAGCIDKFTSDPTKYLSAK